MKKRIKKPNNWIKGALSGGKNKGALKRTALRKGLLRNIDEKLSMTDLKKLEKVKGTTSKRAHLAKTLRKFDGGGDTLQDKIDHINKTYDVVTASKTYSDNRIQVVSPYFNTLNEIKRKEFGGSALMEKYGNTSSYVLYSNKNYANGGSVTSDIEKAKKKIISKAKSKGITENFGQKEVMELEDKYGHTQEVNEFDNWVMNFDMEQLSKYEHGGSINDESLVREALVNGEIDCSTLTDILQDNPKYPHQIVGSIKLEKCFLRPYYRIVSK